MTAGSRGRGGVCPAALALSACLAAGGAWAQDAAARDLRVCVDNGSPTAARDRAVAARVASQAGLHLAVTGFDSGDDDDGFPARKFRELLTKSCDLVMGYPVDLSDTTLPAGLAATKPYAQTGFVLVTAPGQTAHKLADLPDGTEVAVTFQTPPNLYFADHANVSADIHQTEAETMQAVASGAAKAAMLWQPVVESYRAANPAAARLAVYPLDEPHARFDVVALYLPGAHQGATFNASGISWLVPAATAAAAPLPALYTDAQAKVGYAKFLGNCAMCHGTHLEGRSGPTLRGPNWANEKAAYTVGEVFTVVSQQMPATGPGSLAHDDYVQIMAFLLKQNGYPAGDKPLEFDPAGASTVPLRWHG